nr:collagen alpha-2(I) chain-like [Saimiri boliviensis boliviensis]
MANQGFRIYCVTPPPGCDVKGNPSADTGARCPRVQTLGADVWGLESEALGETGPQGCVSGPGSCKPSSPGTAPVLPAPLRSLRYPFSAVLPRLRFRGQRKKAFSPRASGFPPTSTPAPVGPSPPSRAGRSRRRPQICHRAVSPAAAEEGSAGVRGATSELALGTLQLLKRCTRSPSTPCPRAAGGPALRGEEGCAPSFRSQLRVSPPASGTPAREPLCCSGRCKMEKSIWGRAAFPRQRGYLCPQKGSGFLARTTEMGKEGSVAKPGSDLKYSLIFSLGNF